MPFRVILVLMFALCSVFAATSPPAINAQDATPAATCPTTTEEENEILALRWHDDAINGHDLAVIDDIVTDDIIHHSGTFPDGEGPGDVKMVLGALFDGFPDVHHTVEQVIAKDDVVVTRWSSEGTHEGDFQGFAPSGERVTWTGINIFRIECGLIAEEWSELDGIGRLAQMEAAATPTP